jgi:hypothetical protein
MIGRRYRIGGRSGVGAGKLGVNGGWRGAALAALECVRAQPTVIHGRPCRRRIAPNRRGSLICRGIPCPRAHTLRTSTFLAAIVYLVSKMGVIGNLHNDTAINEHVVGFDARTIVVPDWLQRRRDEYLLRPEVVHPHSADEMVWPSVLDQPSAPGNQTYAPPKSPDWIGRNAPLWDDLRALVACLDNAWGVTWNPCQLIAVSLPITLCAEGERKAWEDRLEATTPSIISKAWNLIGYDVCDQWLLSGLMNCGYMPDQEEVGTLRRRWAPYLNEHHLFIDLEQATQFRLISDKRVEEHAPFFVFGIYTIPADWVRKFDTKVQPAI